MKEQNKEREDKFIRKLRLEGIFYGFMLKIGLPMIFITIVFILLLLAK